jgi:hypothetical protein
VGAGEGSASRRSVRVATVSGAAAVETGDGSTQRVTAAARAMDRPATVRVPVTVMSATTLMIASRPQRRDRRAGGSGGRRAGSVRV